MLHGNFRSKGNIMRSKIVKIFFATIAILFIPLVPCSAVTYTPPANNRVDTPLTGVWKFNLGDVNGAQAANFNDSSWSNITLPHTWNNLDGQDGGSYTRGIGWYRIHFTPPVSQSGRRFFVQFDAAFLVTDVYVNGTQVGEHQGGFTAFRYDITGLLNVGADNVIAVKVNSSWKAGIGPISGGYTMCGGLYRMAHIICTDPVHARMGDSCNTGVYITPTNVTSTSANLSILTGMWNDGGTAQTVTVNSVIVDATNTVVTTLSSTQTVAAYSGWNCTQNTTIANPHLWNGVASPYLYHVYTEIRTPAGATDVVVNPLGFRSFSVSPSAGFTLNGTHYDLHGVNKHQEQWNKGWAVTDADQDRDISLITDMGATGIRLCHYPHPQHTYDLCDQTGLIVWSEIPNINNISTDPNYLPNMTQQLTEMIKQNYNHPSICFWSLANEITTNPDPTSLLQSLNTTAHNLDSTRLTTLASVLEPSDASNKITDITAYNRYYGWYYNPPSYFDGWLDYVHTNNPTMSLGISEYGGGGSLYVHTSNPVQKDHSEEYQAYLHENNWNTLSSRPWSWCKFVWVGMDFALDNWSEGDSVGRNDKGLISADRQTMKDAYYYYKAVWSKSPFVYITGRRFNNRPGQSRTVKVYSNATTVELIMNGYSQGTRTSTNGVFTWNITLWPYGNTVTANAVIGGKTYTDSVNWFVPPAGPSDGVYTIINQTSGMMIEDTGTGSPVQNMVNGHRAQHWVVSSASSGNVTIRNASTNLYLTSPTGTTTATLAVATGDNTQLWLFAQVGNAYRLTNIATGLVIEDPAGNTNGGTVLDVAAANSALYQSWVFNPAYQIASGTYHLTNVASGLMMDDVNSNNTPGIPAPVTTPNGGKDQLWIVTQLGNGYYSIVDAATGLALDEPWTSGPATLHLYGYSGYSNQQWSIEMTTLGLLVQNHFNYLPLDAGANVSGTNTLVNYLTGGSTQTWLLN